MPIPTHLEPIDWALIQACDTANVDDVARLLPLCDLRKSNFAAFRGAVRKGHAAIVQLFVCTRTALPKDAALQDAVLRGHVNVAQMLIGSDFDANGYALQTAAAEKNRQMIELLLPVCDYKRTLARIQHNNTESLGYTDTHVFEQCIEEYENDLQRQRLEHAVGPSQRSSARKI